MDYQKLKSLIDNKNIAIEICDGYVRVNYEIGNDSTWTEFEIDNRSEEEMADLINTHVSKMKTGEISQI